MNLLAVAACALLGASGAHVPNDLHVTAECVDKVPWDKSLAPQCNLYVGSEPDLAVEFKITHGDGAHPDFPTGSTIYLAVSRYFFEAELSMQKPPVDLAVGKSYDLRLEKSPDGSHWNYKIKAR
jgi:hypothetical protein